MAAVGSSMAAKPARIARSAAEGSAAFGWAGAKATWIPFVPRIGSGGAVVDAGGFLGACRERGDGVLRFHRERAVGAAEAVRQQDGIGPAARQRRKCERRDHELVGGSRIRRLGGKRREHRVGGGRRARARQARIETGLDGGDERSRLADGRLLDGARREARRAPGCVPAGLPAQGQAARTGLRPAGDAGRGGAGGFLSPRRRGSARRRGRGAGRLVVLGFVGAAVEDALQPAADRAVAAALAIGRTGLEVGERRVRRSSGGAPAPARSPAAACRRRERRASRRSGRAQAAAGASCAASIGRCRYRHGRRASRRTDSSRRRRPGISTRSPAASKAARRG